MSCQARTIVPAGSVTYDKWTKQYIVPSWCCVSSVKLYFNTQDLFNMLTITCDLKKIGLVNKFVHRVFPK